MLAPTVASVITGSHPAAIAVIYLRGQNAASIIASIFKPAISDSPLTLGRIYDNDRIIDEVVIASESPDSFAINCHGNPLIIQNICKLLTTSGAEIIAPLDFAKMNFSPDQNTIALEAQLAALSAKTIAGYKLLKNQITSGLSTITQNWLTQPNIALIHNQAQTILANSIPADLIIHGCRIILPGPPNSGKSTLLNLLTGSQTAIVSETAGTTRDYVTAHCSLEPLHIEFIDTAGLDETLTQKSDIDHHAQKLTKQLLASADLVLYLTDAQNPTAPNIAAKKILHVYNKIDTCNTAVPSSAIPISAKTAQGIENLTSAILPALAVKDFDLTTPIAFTPRQKDLLTGILSAHDLASAKHLITQLSSAPVRL